MDATSGAGLKASSLHGSLESAARDEAIVLPARKSSFRDGPLVYPLLVPFYPCFNLTSF